MMRHRPIITEFLKGKTSAEEFADKVVGFTNGMKTVDFRNRKTSGWINLVESLRSMNVKIAAIENENSNASNCFVRDNHYVDRIKALVKSKKNTHVVVFLGSAHLLAIKEQLNKSGILSIAVTSFAPIQHLEYCLKMQRPSSVNPLRIRAGIYYWPVTKFESLGEYVSSLREIMKNPKRKSLLPIRKIDHNEKSRQSEDED